MSDLTVTIESDPFRREHIEGAPGAYRAIIHTGSFPSKALELATGPTKGATMLNAAARLRQMAGLLEAEARR